MRAAVIGMGSIGRRHADNLKRMGVKVIGCDIGDRLAYDVDFAAICVPDDLHLAFIESYNLERVPVFVEKPVTASLDHLAKLEQLEIKVPSMVACNLRFTSALDFAKNLADRGGILNIHARVCDSNPLRSKYGDIVLQDIHEFDYLSWLLGPIKRIDLNKFYDGKSYEASILFKSGRMASVHGDMLSETYFRRMTIQTAKYTFDAELDIDNKMYEREMEYFIRCLNNKQEPMNNVKESLHVARKLLEALDRCNRAGASNVHTFTSQDTSGNSRTVSSSSCGTESIRVSLN